MSLFFCGWPFFCLRVVEKNMHTIFYSRYSHFRHRRQIRKIVWCADPPCSLCERKKSATQPFALCFYVICTSNVAYNQGPNNNKTSTAHKHLHCVHLEPNDNEMPMPGIYHFVRDCLMSTGSGWAVFRWSTCMCVRAHICCCWCCWRCSHSNEIVLTNYR